MDFRGLSASESLGDEGAALEPAYEQSHIVKSKELAIPDLLAANADSKNAAWASRGTHQKTMETMYFLQGARRTEFLTVCTFTQLTKINENVVKTMHFRNSYRLQSAGTYHPRALHLRKEVVVSVQNH